MTHNATTAPRRRGRPRKTLINQQFSGTVIPFNSRPRLMVGDVVELCRGVRLCNQGKLATVEAFQDDGRVLVRSMHLLFDTFDFRTGAPTGPSMIATVLPEDLYRRSNALAKGC